MAQAHIIPFTLSIEDTEGHIFQHGFHLGTDETLARQIAEEKFHGRANNGLPVVTVALMRNRKMVDCYYGSWANADALSFEDEENMQEELADKAKRRGVT